MIAVGLACIFLYHVRDFFHNDSYITLRYAQRILAGQGNTWTDGERVEGYTNPLWLGQLVLFGATGVDLPLLSRILGVAYLFGFAALWYLFRLWPPALLLLTTNLGFIVWSISGMESVGFCFLISTTLLLTWRLVTEPESSDTYPLSALAGLAAALASLTRPEGMLAGVFAIGIVAALNRNVRQAFWIAASFTVPVGLYEIYRIFYFGDLLSNSSYAKVDGISPVVQLKGFLYYLSASKFILVPALSCGLLALWIIPVRYRLLGLFAIPTLVAVALGGGDHMIAGRLLLPVIAVAACLAGLALHQRVDSSNSLSRALQGLAIVAVLFQSYYFWTRPYVPEDGAAAVGKPIGRFLQTTVPPGTLIATASAGAFPFYAPSLRFIDSLGLADRHIAHAKVPGIYTNWQNVPGHRKGDAEYLLSRSPDIIILGPSQGFNGKNRKQWFLSDYQLMGMPEFHRDYSKYNFDVPGPLAPPPQIKEDAGILTAFLRNSSPLTELRAKVRDPGLPLRKDKE
ncbi:MAG: hypothetical protein H7039_11955 [Bryobacteraceae bacterium]|nr:hypothetical protein [Bryobacteraceae bacterium]